MDSNSSKANSILKSAFILKMIEGFKYIVKISNTKTTAVNVKNVESKPSGSNWFIRFHNPHKGVLYPHINIRPKNTKYTGYVDLHLPLPTGGLNMAKGTAYAAKALDWLCYLNVAYDTYQLGEAVFKDHQDGMTCDTTQCATEKTGQYVGGFVGAACGKTVGSLLIPVIGPLVGTLALGVLGVKYGKELAPKGASYLNYCWSGGKFRVSLTQSDVTSMRKNKTQFRYRARAGDHRRSSLHTQAPHLQTTKSNDNQDLRSTSATPASLFLVRQIDHSANNYTPRSASAGVSQLQPIANTPVFNSLHCNDTSARNAPPTITLDILYSEIVALRQLNTNMSNELFSLREMNSKSLSLVQELKDENNSLSTRVNKLQQIVDKMQQMLTSRTL